MSTKGCCEKCSNPHSDLTENCVEQLNCPCHQDTKQTWRDRANKRFTELVGEEPISANTRASFLMVLAEELATYREGVIKAIDTVEITETSADTKELAELTRVLWKEGIKPHLLKAIKDMGV